MNNLKELSVEQARQRLNDRVELSRKDPILFVDKFCYTFDPKREPYHLPFLLFDFQKDLIFEVKQAIEQGYDIFIEKCREMGVTYTALDLFLWFWLNVEGSNFLIGSRKEDYVDSTGSSEISNREESLFGKLEYTLRRLPQFMLPIGFDYRKHFTYMSLTNPVNGNSIAGESSNPNFSRGGRQKAILLDEFAFWDNDSSAWGATADTTNCRIILTTPGIRPSKAKRLRFGKDGEKIKVITLPYNLDPRKTKEWLENQRSRRSSEDFDREIMINWEGSITGKVYKEIEYRVEGKYPLISNAGIYCSWDFGLDGVAIQIWQYNKESKKMRLVDCYTNHDKPIQFYFRLFGIEEFKDDMDRLIVLKDMFDYTEDDEKAIEDFAIYRGMTHYGDPDVAKRSLLTGTSTYKALSRVNIYVATNPMSNDFGSRKEKTKVMLQSGIEINTNPRTDYWLECMLNARYPKREETSQSTGEIKLPIHDWTSHHRSCTEYLAVNFDTNQAEIFITNDRPRTARDSFIVGESGTIPSINIKDFIGDPNE